VAIGLVMVMAGGEVQAQTTGWESGPSAGPVGVERLIPRMDSDESYSERYTFGADLDGGGRIKFEFTITNYGWGDGHGAAAVKVFRPGRPDYEFSRKVNDWSYDKKPFAMTIAGTRVEAVGEGRFRLTHNGKVDVDVTFQNTLPMWQPGDGQINSGDRYFTLMLMAPRADVAGTLGYGDERVEITGTRSGLADHSASRFAPYDLARRFSRFYHFNDEVFIAWREIALTEKRGGESLTWLVVGYRDQIVFSDAGARIKFAKFRRDRQTGYKIPRLIQIDGVDGADSVRLVIRAERARRVDLLDEHGALVRLFASAVTEPYQYVFDGEYELQMTIEGASARVDGSVEFSMDYLN
jgi:hypothetical protein